MQSSRKRLSALLGEEETRAETLIADYVSHSVFMVPPGEIESWLIDAETIGKDGTSSITAASSPQGTSRFIRISPECP